MWNIEYNTGPFGGQRRNATVATDERGSGPSGTVNGWMTSGQTKEEIISQPLNNEPEIIEDQISSNGTEPIESVPFNAVFHMHLGRSR